MARFKSVSWKIFVGYVLVVVFSLTVTGMAFQAMIRTRLIREAMYSLINQGIVIAQSLSHIQLNERNVIEKILINRTFQFADRLLEGEYIVINQKSIVVGSSQNSRFPVGSVRMGLWLVFLKSDKNDHYRWSRGERLPGKV